MRRQCPIVKIVKGEFRLVLLTEDARREQTTLQQKSAFALLVFAYKAYRPFDTVVK
jgi:hypothetical protein